MKIKICGIRSLDDIELMNFYKPDFIGFIFFPKSKRYITFKQAKKLKNALDPDIKTVGVFVDEDIQTVIDSYNQGITDIVQLHGKENQAYIDSLKALNIPVIKAVRVKEAADLDQTGLMTPDYYLFDVKSNTFVGGTGESFDWHYLNRYEGETPFFLAGGINKDNIKEALKTQANVLDVSSGVETDFKKDKLKVEELFKIYRQKQ